MTTDTRSAAARGGHLHLSLRQRAIWTMISSLLLFPSILIWDVYIRSADLPGDSQALAEKIETHARDVKPGANPVCTRREGTKPGYSYIDRHLGAVSRIRSAARVLSENIAEWNDPFDAWHLFRAHRTELTDALNRLRDLSVRVRDITNDESINRLCGETLYLDIHVSHYQRQAPARNPQPEAAAAYLIKMSDELLSVAREFREALPEAGRERMGFHLLAWGLAVFEVVGLWWAWKNARAWLQSRKVKSDTPV